MALDSPGSGVEDQVVDGYKGTSESRGKASAQHTTNSCQQLDWGERFWYVVVGAGLKSIHFICHRCSGLVGIAAMGIRVCDSVDQISLQNTEAVFIGQHYIKDNQNQAALFCPAEARFRGIPKVNYVSFGTEVFGQHFGHVPVVIDQQNRSPCIFT